MAIYHGTHPFRYVLIIQYFAIKFVMILRGIGYNFVINLEIVRMKNLTFLYAGVETNLRRGIKTF